MSEDSGGDETVRLTVDLDRCVGVGQCELLEPEVFRVDDDSGLAVVAEGSALQADRAERVIQKCPSGAIAVESDE